MSLGLDPLRLELEIDAGAKSAFNFKAQWAGTASLSGMQCVHGGHVGWRGELSSGVDTIQVSGINRLFKIRAKR